MKNMIKYWVLVVYISIIYKSIQNAAIIGI